MFSFLNSTILVAAAAALIPLIIHLFSKRRVKVIEFSSLKHLKQMQRRQVRRLKIRQLLLLILRMLIILLVVLAFARPTTKSGDIGSHASVTAVIILDNSVSMKRYVADGDLFEIARKRTEQLLNTFGEADQVCLATLGRSSETGPNLRFTSAATAAKLLAQVKPHNAVPDFQSILDKVSNLLQETHSLNKEIYIVTDRQKNLLPNLPLPVIEDTRLYFVDLPLEAINNVGLTSVDFGGQLILPGHDFTITATVANYGNHDDENLIASLFIDGNRIAQTDFSVEAGADASIRFVRSVSTTGFHSGYVEISDDRFMADNRFYFSFRIPDRFNVLIIGSDMTREFFSLALAPSQSVNSYWSLKQAGPNELSGVNFWDYDVIVLAGMPELAPTYVTRLKAFVRTGKSLFLSYGGETDVNTFNRDWADIAGVVFDEPLKRPFSRAGFYTLQSVDQDHPVFSVFDFVDDRPPEIKFYTLPKSHIIGDAATLMQFTGNRPALVEAKPGKGKALTFCGLISPEYSDLTGHAFFVPFISRIAEYLASDLSSLDLKLFVGANVTRGLSLNGTISGSLDLIVPDSSRYSIPPEEQQGALVLKAKPTDLPGIYSVKRAGQEIDRFAVNTDPSECDLTSVDTDQLSLAAGIGEFNSLDFQSDLSVAISESRLGKELWQLFLWIALALILGEFLLARTVPSED